ncbi:MAG: hypothetical protein ACI8YQ_004716 [Polaribacter sp.]|jgi:hypothetical protein
MRITGIDLRLFFEAEVENVKSKLECKSKSKSA